MYLKHKIMVQKKTSNRLLNIVIILKVNFEMKFLIN